MILANVNALRAITITVTINTSWVHTTSLTTKISYISLSKSIRAVLIMMVCKRKKKQHLTWDIMPNGVWHWWGLWSSFCTAEQTFTPKDKNCCNRMLDSLKSSPLWRIVWFSFCFSAQHTAVTHPFNYWWAADTAECLARARLPLGVDAHIVTVTARITVIGFFLALHRDSLAVV